MQDLAIIDHSSLKMRQKLVLLMCLIALILIIPVSSFAQNRQYDGTLDALETTIAGNLFFAFTTLKSLGDAFESGAYTKIELYETLNLIDKILDKIQVRLVGILNKYSEERDNFIRESIESIQLLKKMEYYLNIYSKDKSKENYKLFIESQKTAWKKMKPLLTKAVN